MLTDRGLAAALAEQLARPGVPVRLEIDPQLGRWSPDVEAAAYFVACEALTNAMKHADANEVVVALDSPEGDLRIRVRDDGCGFDPHEVDLRGLDGVRDRVEALGGRFSVSSVPGRGTEVEMIVSEVPR